MTKWDRSQGHISVGVPSSKPEVCAATTLNYKRKWFPPELAYQVHSLSLFSHLSPASCHPLVWSMGQNNKIYHLLIRYSILSVGVLSNFSYSYFKSRIAEAYRSGPGPGYIAWVHTFQVCLHPELCDFEMVTCMCQLG